MGSEIRKMMPLSEAIEWVHKWRIRHFNKSLGIKDKALVTLAHEVIRLNELIDQLSAPVRTKRDAPHTDTTHDH